MINSSWLYSVEVMQKGRRWRSHPGLPLHPRIGENPICECMLIIFDFVTDIRNTGQSIRMASESLFPTRMSPVLPPPLATNGMGLGLQKQRICHLPLLPRAPDYYGQFLYGMIDD